MRKTFACIPVLCVIAVSILAPGAARAQALQTFVAGGGGDDANPCSRIQPCKTFAGAIAKTAAGGEIDALDPGGFGAVTITKSVTIDGGKLAGVLVSGTNAIVVAAGANDVVILRNLDIDGLATGLSGIDLVSGGKLVVENCTIEGFIFAGISIAPSGGTQAVVSNATVKNSVNGIAVSTSNAIGTVGVLVSDSRVLQSSSAGISATVPAGKPGATVLLDRVASEFNSTGVAASGGGAAIVLGNSTVRGNATGVSQSGGGSVASFNNNEVAGNGVDGTPLAAVGLN